MNLCTLHFHALLRHDAPTPIEGGIASERFVLRTAIGALDSAASERFLQ